MAMKVMTPSTDWERMQHGDEAALARIYQEHVRHLLNYGLRLYGSLSAVEDAVQELFTELWQHRHTSVEPQSVRFYLLKAIRNKLSRQYRRDQPFVSGWDQPPEHPFEVEPSSEQRWIELDVADQQRDRIRAAMNTLTPRQREILYLRYFNDLGYEQICDLTGLNYQSARSQVYQALKVLRTLLDKHSLSIMILSLTKLS